jgi:uncharacterized membrane protein
MAEDTRKTPPYHRVLFGAHSTPGVVLGAGLTAFANEKFGPEDGTTLEGITQPTDSESSGSPDSLVQRDDLGFQGRTFTGSATTTEDLQTFPACSLNI